jgi:hypothetical protein
VKTVRQRGFRKSVELIPHIVEPDNHTFALTANTHVDGDSPAVGLIKLARLPGSELLGIGMVGHGPATPWPTRAGSVSSSSDAGPGIIVPVL